MLGIKNDSKIIRLKRPETKIGRNRSNNVVLARSLKISRYHAVIRFFDDLPFIKDVSDEKLSEWGVFINGTAVFRNRWVEIQVGDVVAFGAARTEEDGCITEIVDLEPEEDEPTDFNNVATQRPSSVNPKLETIDISTDVIDLDDEEIIQNEDQIAPRPPSVPAVKTANSEVASSVLCISDDDDDDDDVIHFTFPTDDVKPSRPNAHSKTTTVLEVPETKPLDVTPTMNGSLKLPSAKSAPLSPPSISPATPSNDDIENQLAAVVGFDTPMNTSPIPCEMDVKPMGKLPIVKQEFQFPDTQELQNVLNYSMPDEIISLDSDEEDFPSQLNTTSVTDTPDYSSTFSLMYELKSEIPSDDEDVEFVGSDSWFGPLSQTIADVKSEMSKSWRTSDKVSEHVELSSPMDIDPTSAEANEALSNEFPDPSRDDVDHAESTSVEPSTSDSSLFIKPSSTSLSKDMRKPFLPKGHPGKSVPIALIQPLPNKTHKRRSSDSTEIDQKKRKEKHESSESSHRSRSHTTEHKSSDRSKKSSHRSSSSTSRKETMEKIREKVKALHPEPPTVEKKGPKENKVQPKVKVTTKNRGDFLTKLDTSSSTSTSSPSTSNKSKPDDQPLTSSKPSSHKSESKSEPGEHTSSVYKPKVHRIAHTSGEADSFKISPTSPITNDEIPVRPSRAHFPKLPITSSSKSISKSILKKSSDLKLTCESKPQSDNSKKVKFPDNYISGCKEIDKLDDVSELSWRKKDMLIRECSIEFNHALSIILKWNVKWLQEQQKHTAPPPLYPAAYENGNIFNSIEKYQVELKNSMFHQMWKQIFGNWNTPNNDNLPLTQNPNSCDCIIDIEKVEIDSKDSTNSLLMIYAKCQNPDAAICNGKLSILSCRISKPSSESETKTMVFAYIFSYNKSYDSMGRVCYRIVLKIFAKQFHIVRGPAKLKVLNYARGHLKKFQAFGMTRSCPIIDAICDINFRDYLNTIKTSEMKNNKNKLLDPSQKKAVSVSKSCLYKESSVNFIDGPCGTGKTQAIVGLVHELFYSNFNDKILIITVNDKLADDLVYRICKDENIKNVLRFGNCLGMNNHVKHCAFENKVMELLNTDGGKDLVCVDDEMRLVEAQRNCNRFLSGIDNSKNKEEIYDKIKQCEKELNDLALENSPSMFKIKEQVARARVVETANVIVTSFSTCWSSLFEHYFIPNSVNKGDVTPFSICIIDDANFHDENSILIPQILQIPHLVLVGDRNAKLYQNSPYHKILHYFNLNNKDFITCLDEDHRMHADVSSWVRNYYKLNTDLKVPISKRNSKFKPFLIIDHISGAGNEYQTILSDKLAQCILETEPDRPFGLTIMVTRTFEKENIRSQLTTSNIHNRVRVDLFDGMSTRESDVVIVCLPLSRIFEQWLYVALTRAKSTMIVCGDFSKIEPVPAITSLLEYGKNSQVFYSLRSPDLMTPDRLKNILAA